MSIRLLLAFILCFLGGGENPQLPAEKPARKLWAGLSVNHAVFHPGLSSSRLTVSFGLVNDSDKTINPDLDSSKLLVNGKELENWILIINNGIQPHNRDAIRPGDYLLFSIALEERFRLPGEYRLVWKGKEFQSAELVFRVLPPDR